MRTFFIIAAGALLLAAVIVELSSRLWPDSTLALLVLAALALVCQGYLSLRLIPAAATSGTRQPRNTEARERAPEKPAERRPARESRPARGNRPAPADGPREKGTVKWFNRTKGFGFIVRESGEEIFVHQRSIRADEGARRPSLKDGQAVTFTVSHREKGPQAEDVEPA